MRIEMSMSEIELLIDAKCIVMSRLANALGSDISPVCALALKRTVSRMGVRIAFLQNLLREKEQYIPVREGMLDPYQQ